MVKVVDPAEGGIIGVFASVADVPARVWNRWSSYAFPKEECDIEEVTDPEETVRLQKALERCAKEYHKE